LTEQEGMNTDHGITFLLCTPKKRPPKWTVSMMQKF